MTITNSYLRQPTQLDYASPTQFKFNISKLPKVEYFCTAVNVPGISLNFVEQRTPLKDIPVPGEKLTYSDLEVSFLVDENLQNYQELHNWLTGLGFPEDNAEFKSLSDAGSDRFPTSSSAVSNEIGKVKYGAPSAGSTLSDATLMILTSKNNPVVEVRFADVFPISIGALQYNQQANDINYLSVNCVFKYSIYKFANVGSSSTTITHT
jgi:hypothetical protein|tara:strand:- start:3042 stop:3665 length:624 start_codon:yes stop_codon:yes gene_type:complete